MNNTSELPNDNTETTDASNPLPVVVPEDVTTVKAKEENYCESVISDQSELGPDSTVPDVWRHKMLKKCVAFAFSHIGLVLLVVVYTIMGGFLFQHLEGKSEIIQRTLVSRIRIYTVAKLWNMTTELTTPYEPNWTVLANHIVKEFQEEIVLAIKKKGWDGRAEDNEDQKWSLPGSLLYSITVLTTIGYGHITPKTLMGRVATMLYALPGIPLTLLCLSTIGATMAKCFRFFYQNVSHRLTTCTRCRHNTEASGHTSIDDINKGKEKTVRVPLFVSLMIMGGYIATGAGMFDFWERDWDFIEAAYFCFITLSTIGFGDYVFGIGRDLDSNTKLISSAVYLIIGLAVIAMCFNLMQEEVKEKFLSFGIYFGFIERKKKRKIAKHLAL